MAKRKRADSRLPSDTLNEHERKLYDAIRAKQDMGINKADLRQATGLLDTLVTRSLKSLMSKNLIKEVQNIHKKGLKHYMGIEYEPSKEITGGAWYVDGNLDTNFIKELKNVCVRLINARKVATLETLWDVISNKVAKVSLTKKQIEEILKALVLDNEVVEVKSTGMGEFASIPAGQLCYKCTKKQNTEPKLGAFASTPCGACPRISYCTPDGVISPKTCTYYSKWLEF